MPTVINNRQTSRECAVPQVLYGLLPPRLMLEVEKSLRKYGQIEEIRIRRDRCASITRGRKNEMLEYVFCAEEMEELLVKICGNSLYAHSQSINQGYITLDGAIRVGIVGRAAMDEGKMLGVYDICAMCFRLPHRIDNVGEQICRFIDETKGSSGVLIYSPPGEGKTTLLRGVAQKMSSGERARRVAVIDTREELGFSLEGQGLCVDILRGYPRALGIEIASRTMNAQLIICDEIGDVREADAIIAAQNCGVPFVASAHADSISGLLCRTAFRRLHRARVFGKYVGIKRTADGKFEYQTINYEEADDYYQADRSANYRN